MPVLARCLLAVFPVLPAPLFAWAATSELSDAVGLVQRTAAQHQAEARPSLAIAVSPLVDELPSAAEVAAGAALGMKSPGAARAAAGAAMVLEHSRDKLEQLTNTTFALAFGDEANRTSDVPALLQRLASAATKSGLAKVVQEVAETAEVSAGVEAGVWNSMILGIQGHIVVPVVAGPGLNLVALTAAKFPKGDTKPKMYFCLQAVGLAEPSLLAFKGSQYESFPPKEGEIVPQVVVGFGNLKSEPGWNLEMGSRYMGVDKGYTVLGEWAFKPWSWAPHSMSIEVTAEAFNIWEKFADWADENGLYDQVKDLSAQIEAYKEIGMEAVRNQGYLPGGQEKAEKLLENQHLEHPDSKVSGFSGIGYTWCWRFNN